MKKLNYSFIIPHHNNKFLLERLVNTIPSRDDLEIIVIDDNSDELQKPYFDRNDVFVSYITREESKWAGHARNIGLSKAKGRFIIFADDDDYFADNFLDILDKYINLDFHILYFGCLSVDSVTLMPSFRTELRESYLDKFAKGEGDYFKYIIRFPWGKMIRRDWVVKNKFKFEEIQKGNDMMFTYLTNYFASKTLIIRDPLYICTYRNDSMTYQKRGYESHITSLENYFKIKGFYEFVGHPKWGNGLLRIVVRVFKNAGLVVFCKVCINLSLNASYYRTLRSYYASKIIEYRKWVVD